MPRATARRPERILNDRPRQRVLRELRNLIASGRLPRGESLPSEHGLAAQLDATRSTVHLALKQLEDEGLLRSLPGRGRVVADERTAGTSTLSDVVIVLTTSAADEREAAGRQAGWADFTQFGTLEALRQAGLNTFILQPGGPGRERLARLAGDRPSGVVVLGDAFRAPDTAALLEDLRARGVPVVVDMDEPETEGFDQVLSDQESGCYELTRWLIGRGCRRILRFWQVGTSRAHRPLWLARRDAGYERAVQEAGCPSLPPVEYRGPLLREESDEEFLTHARLAAGFLLEHLTGRERPDALLVISDGLVFQVAAATRLFGLEPNRDLAIVGYDRYWEDCLARRWDPVVPLATVDKLNRRIGREMVSVILERAAGKLGPVPVRRLVKPELVVTSQDAARPR
jgi:DNA-binding LacI/PurR family transcriptional regulator